MHNRLIRSRHSLPVPSVRRKLWLLLACEGMVYLLPQAHPECCSGETTSAKERLRWQTSENRVDDGEEIHRLPLHVALADVNGRVVVVVVVNLLQLPEYDCGGYDAIPVFVVSALVKVPKRRYAPEDVLDSCMLAQTGKKLPVIHDAPTGLVLGQTYKVACGECKHGVEEMGVLPGPDGDDDLEVSFLITKIKLDYQL